MKKLDKLIGKLSEHERLMDYIFYTASGFVIVSNVIMYFLYTNASAIYYLIIAIGWTIIAIQRDEINQLKKQLKRRK